MPAEFYIDVPRRMVFSRGGGLVTFADCRGHMDRLLRQPDFRPEFNQLLDFRATGDVVISGEEMVLLAARKVFSPQSRRAFVVIRLLLQFHRRRVADGARARESRRRL